MISEKDFKRLRWASRRGMLELDLMLVPFVEQRFMALNDYDQRCFIKLIEGEDTDMFSWFLGRKDPSDVDLKNIVDQIKAFSKIVHSDQ